MLRKLASIAIALLFIITLVPSSTQAGYTMAITGRSDFTATPYQTEIFSGPDVYVRIYLSDTSPSSLLINMTVDGDLGQYITFPEFSGEPSFTLFPGENRKVLYTLSLPVSAPGKYTGTILAVGNPPATEIPSGAGAIGKPVVGISIVADVPSEIQIFNFVTHTNGFPDGQWDVWGDGWDTNISVVNGGTNPFSGWCDISLTGGIIFESQRFNITNLSVSANVTLGKAWQNGLPLNAQYTVTAAVYSDQGDRKDEEAMSFTIPSPADIDSVEHVPSQVFSSDTVAVYATLASSDSTVTLHWRLNNGTETTAQMVSGGGEFSATLPAQAIGSTVQYWVTSENGVYTDRSPATGSYSYYVFSPDVPDLAIDADSLTFSPYDPTNYTMNETDITNIYILVRNLGRGVASDIRVRVYDYETPIWNTSVSQLEGQGGSTALRFTWMPLEGNHILRFEVDPDNEIVELNENNNHYTMPEVTVNQAPPGTFLDADESPLALLPYILIPLILAMLIILFLRRKRVVNVTVATVKPSRHSEDGVQRWIYSCSVAGRTIGNTRATKVRAEEGSVIQVRVSGIKEDEEGNLAWWNPEVIGPGEKEDPIDTVRKIAKQAKGS